MFTVFIALLLIWAVVAVGVTSLCVAAGRGDAGDRVRRAERRARRRDEAARAMQARRRMRLSA